MISQVMNELSSSVRHRVWVFSDLQQSDPVKSRNCLEVAVQDFKQLNLDCDQIWYLGDAIEGEDPELVQDMANMHLELLQPLSIPLRYVLGNHDFDILRHYEGITTDEAFPFYHTIRTVPQWKTTPDLQSFYFLDTLGEYEVVFLSDHCGSEGEWFTTNGSVHGPAKQAYPYTESDYGALSERIASSGKPTIIASHYAFAGGNRPSGLLRPMLPLPANVRIHFHGHAHIGDTVWAGKDCYKKISFVESQPLPQINVSSLENERGDQIRSVIFEIYEDHSMGVYFRDHGRGVWANMYMQEGNKEDT